MTAALEERVRLIQPIILRGLQEWNVRVTISRQQAVTARLMRQAWGPRLKKKKKQLHKVLQKNVLRHEI